MFGTVCSNFVGLHVSIEFAVCGGLKHQRENIILVTVEGNFAPPSVTKCYFHLVPRSEHLQKDHTVQNKSNCNNSNWTWKFWSQCCDKDKVNPGF